MSVPAPKLSKSRRGPPGGASYFDRKPGVRELREYPITAEELESLGLLHAGSTAAFTFAGACFGFWLNGVQTAALSVGVKLEELAYWNALHTVALGLSIISVAIGLVLYLKRGSQLSKIKKSTTH
jgi:hypothetical protein